jgi:serine/threonine protein kinase
MNEEYINALPVGSPLDSLILGKVLGQGGFGITYQAKDSGGSAVYAVKELFPDGMVVREGNTQAVTANSSGDQLDWDDTCKRFINEAQVLATVNHPAVVKVHRLLKANGTFYMVMDYIEGGDLSDILKQGGGKIKDKAELVSIFLPVMQGLHVLHSRGLVHKDVKPANIMVPSSRSGILLDFGSVSRVHSKTITIEQAVSSGYSPLEQYSSQSKQGAYTDIYSLAASMVRCITGVTPPDACDRMRSDTLEPLAANAQYVQRFGVDFLKAIDLGLKLNSKDRPQSITQWIVELGIEEAGPEASEGADITCVIGRSQESDLVVADTSISRKHAKLSSDHAGQVYITDLGSANGTRVNHPDSRIPKSHLLKETDLVYLCENYPLPGSVLAKFYRDWEGSRGRLKMGMTLAEVKDFPAQDIYIGPSAAADLRLPENAVDEVRIFHDGGWMLQGSEGRVKVDGCIVGLGSVALNAFTMIDVGGFVFSLTSTSQRMIVARHCAIVLAATPVGWLKQLIDSISHAMIGTKK